MEKGDEQTLAPEDLLNLHLTCKAFYTRTRCGARVAWKRTFGACEPAYAGRTHTARDERRCKVYVTGSMHLNLAGGQPLTSERYTVQPLFF